MLRITDKGFQYTPSFSTDLRKRFKKMMREQQRAAASVKPPAETPMSNSVVPIARRSIPK
jgi:hypothetical protein